MAAAIIVGLARRRNIAAVARPTAKTVALATISVVHIGRFAMAVAIFKGQAVFQCVHTLAALVLKRWRCVLRKSSLALLTVASVVGPGMRVLRKLDRGHVSKLA
jgi:hypothetical protein